MSSPESKGTVYLVGAGPGDPNLLTVKGARLIAEADVVVYDALVAPQMLDLAGPDTLLRFVGKRGEQHFAEQSEINELLYELSKRFSTVVRLKGGEPFLFGRGAEELDYLAEREVRTEVVPGVTSAVAAPAYAGIPLTHRDFAPMTVIATGHRSRGATPIEWEHLGSLNATVCVLMGVKGLGGIARRLIAGGRPKETPAALVEWGTAPKQRVLVATLETVASRAGEEGFKPPSVLVVGEVVRLEEKLAWFRPAGRVTSF